MRDGVCNSLEQLTEAVEKAEAALFLEELFGGVFAGLCRGEKLAAFTKCVREQNCVSEERVSHGNVRMVLVKSEFRSREYRFSLDDHDRALSVIRASSVGDLWSVSKGFTQTLSLERGERCITALCLLKRRETTRKKFGFVGGCCCLVARWREGVMGMSLHLCGK